MLEWNLPPWRFRRVGTPGFYATWLRPALFATGLATNVERRPRREPRPASAGSGLPVHRAVDLDMTLSFGGAVALEDGTGRGARR